MPELILRYQSLERVVVGLLMSMDKDRKIGWKSTAVAMTCVFTADCSTILFEKGEASGNFFDR